MAGEASRATQLPNLVLGEPDDRGSHVEGHGNPILLDQRLDDRVHGAPALYRRLAMTGRTGPTNTVWSPEPARAHDALGMTSMGSIKPQRTRPMQPHIRVIRSSTRTQRMNLVTLGFSDAKALALAHRIDAGVVDDIRREGSEIAAMT